MSAIKRIEERLSAVEAELAQLRSEAKAPTTPWWKEWMGAFQDDPLLEQAIKHGQDWRRGQKSKRNGRKPKP